MSSRDYELSLEPPANRRIPIARKRLDKILKVPGLLEFGRKTAHLRSGELRRGRQVISTRIDINDQNDSNETNKLNDPNEHNELTEHTESNQKSRNMNI
jgi:hypothetical protein